MLLQSLRSVRMFDDDYVEMFVIMYRMRIIIQIEISLAWALIFLIRGPQRAMEFITKRVDKVPGLREQTNSTAEALTIYNAAPTDELSLDEFEIFALDRLQLLRNIENLKIRGFEGEELKSKVGEVSAHRRGLFFH